MKRYASLAILIAVVGAGSAAAGYPWPPAGCWAKWCRPGRVYPCACPNDYCCKSPACSGWVSPGCVDDYCPKPLPVLLPPRFGPGYTCGPPEICHGPPGAGCKSRR